MAVDLLRREFPLHLGANAELTAAGDGVRVRAGDVEVTMDRVVAALGRRPNVSTGAISSGGCVARVKPYATGDGTGAVAPRVFLLRRYSLSTSLKACSPRGSPMPAMATR